MSADSAPDDGPRYSSGELDAVQRAIAPPPPHPPPEIVGRAGGPVPEHMTPFRKLADLDQPLFQKLTHDPLVEQLSRYAFFPQVRDRLAAGLPAPSVEFTSRTRGPVAILRYEEGPDLVIKPLQNSREPEIAAIAGELGIGPSQHPSLPGYLSEDFAPGVFFTSLPAINKNAESIEGIGQSLGLMLRRLHDAGIYYNDATLCDPEGRSHLIVAEDGGVKLIDFGVSLLLDRHPDLTPEEVRNFVRTLPIYRLFTGIAETREDMDRFLEDYRTRLAQSSKWQIMSRDLTFTQQGAGMAAARMGEHIEEPLRVGFLRGYDLQN